MTKTVSVSQFVSRRVFLGAAAALGVVVAVDPAKAFAVTSAEKQAEADEVRNQLVSLQADLENAANTYYQAEEKRQAAEQAMVDAQKEIDETSVRITQIQDRLGSRARDMYRSGPSSYLDFLLGSTSFEEFTNNWDLLNTLNESDASLVEEAQLLREQLQEAHDEYARQEQEYATQAEIAQQAQDEAAGRVQEATNLMNSLDEEARQLLEQEQAAAAAAEAARQAAAAAAAAGSANNNNNNYYDGGDDNYGESSGGGGGYYNGGSAGDNSAVVGYALSKKGCPYVWGAEGPDAFDCSGLVRWAYLQIGMSLPHYTESLRACATNIVPVSEARPGDVLYRYGHVGIAVGYGGVPYVHAPTFGAVVRDTDALSWSGFTAALQF